MNSFKLEEQSLRLCQERLASMVDDHVIAAVLSAPGGHLLATASRDTTVTAHDIAHMSHLVLALADEQASPRRNRVVCDLKGRPLVILHAGPLILTVVGKTEANMGMVVGIAEHSATELAEGIHFTEVAPSQSSQGFSFDADGFTARVLADIERRKRRGEE